MHTYPFHCIPFVQTFLSLVATGSMTNSVAIKEHKNLLKIPNPPLEEKKKITRQQKAENPFKFRISCHSSDSFDPFVWVEVLEKGAALETFQLWSLPEPAMTTVEFVNFPAHEICQDCATRHNILPWKMEICLFSLRCMV